jgi:spore maturation protein CgeB
MRIFRICPELPHIKEYISHLRKDYLKTFNSLTDKYRDDNILLPGGWKKAVEDKGNEVFECIYADHISQFLWKNENRRNLYSAIADPWSLDKILLEQLILFKPDVVVLYTGALYRVNPALRATIISQISSLKLMVCVWGDEIPAGNSAIDFFSGVDLLFACTKGYCDEFTDAGLKPFLLPSAFDTHIEYEKPVLKDIDVSFIGNTGYLDIDHFQRYEFLRSLFSKRKVIFWGKEKKERKLLSLLRLTFFMAPVLNHLPPIIYRVLRRLSRKISGTLYRIFDVLLHLPRFHLDNRSYRLVLGLLLPFSRPLSKLYKKNYRGVILSGQDYLSVLARSKIVINYHRDEGNDFGNIRCFEVTGVGSCLLTNAADRMKDLFADDEIVGFTTVDDCTARIDLLLQDDEYREKTALKGKVRTLKSHTLDHRISYMLEVINQQIEVVGASRDLQAYKNQRKIFYDLRRRPVSYDFMFFLQACFILQQKFGTNSRLLVVLLIPGNSPNYQASYGWTYEEMKLRTKRILEQLLDFFPTFDRLLIEVSNDESAEELHQRIFSHVPELISLNQQPHHREFYKTVNANPTKIMEIRASNPALKQIREYVSRSRTRSFITVTIRNSRQSPERNNDFSALREFIDYAIRRKGLDVLVIPDADFTSVIEEAYPDLVYSPAAFDFDLRLAIYESAIVNFFVNNGPSVAAELDRKIKSRLFKLVVPSVPHCTVEFIESQGYKFGQSPSYSNDSKWVWAEDTFENMKTELDEIIRYANV